jgi:hypothetical protein
MIFRRTTIALALVVGALATGAVVAGEEKIDHLQLAATNIVPVTPVKMGQLSTVTKPKPTLPPKPVSVTSVKPFLTARPVAPAKPGLVVTAKPRPVIPTNLGQFKTIDLKDVKIADVPLMKAVFINGGKGAIGGRSASTPDAKCSVSGGGSLFNAVPYNFDIIGRAWYRQVPGSPGFHEWFLFEYKVDQLITGGGNSNNVTLRMYEAGTPKFQDTSADDRVLGRWYSVKPASPIYTRSTSSVSFEFEGTFDRSRGDDPRCVARTGRL